MRLNGESLASMQAVDKSKLNKRGQNFNKLLQNIQTDEMTKINFLIYAVPIFVTEKRNMFKKKAKK